MAVASLRWLILAELFNAVASWQLVATPLATFPAVLPRPLLTVHMMADGPPPPVNKGYYTRPSAAFEQGGGFYVPGLEGAKLRLAAAFVLSAGLVLNRVFSPGEAAASQLGSEALGAVGVALLFAQVATQDRQAREEQSNALRATIAARVKEQKEVSAQLPQALTEAATWAAETLLRLTPALGVVWVVDAPTLRTLASETSTATATPSVLLRFGRFPDEAEDASSSNDSGALLALLGTADAIDYSPDVDTESACAPLPRNTASALLHRCGAGGVLAIASERPAAFNAKHRRWLASMASYLEGRG